MYCYFIHRDGGPTSSGKFHEPKDRRREKEVSMWSDCCLHHYYNYCVNCTVCYIMYIVGDI